MGVERRASLGFTADQITAQNFAATQGCVYDLVHNVECCQAGQPAAAIVAAGQAAIEAAIANCGKTAPAPAPAAAPAPVVLQTAIQNPAPAGQPVQPTRSTVTVQTANGAVQMAAEMVPGVSDLALTPAEIRVPNIWDSLDPTKLSQFAYRGLSTSIPVFFAPQYRDAMRRSAAAVAAQTDGGAGGDNGASMVASSDGSGSGLPWWVWLAIGGTAWALRDKHSRSPRAPRKKVTA